MKNYLKATVSLLFLVTAITFLPSVAKAASLSAPTGLRQTDASKTSVSLSWEAQVNAEKYYWSWSKDKVNWSTPGSSDYSYNPKDTIYSLSSGSTYYVRVQCWAEGDSWSSDDDLYSSWSDPIEVVTSPDANTMTDITKTDATPSSIALQWTPCLGATSYNVYDYDSEVLLGSTAATNFTVGNRSANSKFSVKIVPVRTSATGFAASSTYAYKFNFYTKPNTPVTPSTVNFGLDSVYYSLNKVYFAATDKSGTAEGYELCAYTVKGNKLAFTTNNSYNALIVKRNVPYKYRVRYFVTYDGQKIYGGWSPYRYFCFPQVSGKKYSNKIRMSWKKFSGVTGYTVYISTRNNGGFKKVKSLSAKSKGITIRKCGKSKIKRYKSYYVKVVANFKDGKKKVKNDVVYLGNSY